MKIKVFLTVFLAEITALVLVMAAPLILLPLLSGDEEAYCEASGWNCTNEEFENSYMPFYLSRIDELQEEYNIVCEKKIERTSSKDQIYFVLYLYNDYFTMKLLLANRHYGSHGDYMLELYYYGEDKETLIDYEKQKNLVSFVNDLTHEFCFDTKKEEHENHFERLYLECIEAGVDNGMGASYEYHFDHIVGYIGYKVFVNSEDGMARYRYKLQKNENADIFANGFCFNGLLKPIA